MGRLDVGGVGYAFFGVFFPFFILFNFWPFGFLGCLVLSGVLRFLASLLIEIASSRGAGVHACDRHRLSFFCFDFWLSEICWRYCTLLGFSVGPALLKAKLG